MIKLSIQDHLLDSTSMLKLLSMIWCQSCFEQHKTDAGKCSAATTELAFGLFKTTFHSKNSIKWILDSSSCGKVLNLLFVVMLTLYQYFQRWDIKRVSLSVIPSLLVGVRSQDEAMRRRSLGCLAEIASIKDCSTSAFGNLVSFLVDHSEELINDERFVCFLLFTP